MDRYQIRFAYWEEHAPPGLGSSPEDAIPCVHDTETDQLYGFISVEGARLAAERRNRGEARPLHETVGLTLIEE